MPLGALVIAFASLWLFFVSYPAQYGFAMGLKTRFAHSVGYDAMRDFAEAISTKPEGVVLDYQEANPHDRLDPERRAELATRYPFLGWGFGMGTVFLSDGVVALSWGSALAGHWGFRVSPSGPLTDPEYNAIVIRVSDDIQFFCGE